MEFYIVDAVLAQLDLDQVVSEGRGVDGHVQFAQHVGECACVVFVSVSDEDSPNALGVGGQVGDVRKH